MREKQRFSRRASLKSLGILGAGAFCGGPASGNAASASEPPQPAAEIREKIFSQVGKTPFIDTHEHLCDEADRLTKNPLATPTTGPPSWPTT